MAEKQNLTLWQKWNETIYSKDKEILNAIVVSDNTYKPETKAMRAVFKGWMYFYALLIVVVTIMSLIPLGLPDDITDKNRVAFQIMEAFTFFVLLVDLCLRWYTSEVRIRHGNWSYFMFPFTFVGILLIVSLLPSLQAVDKDLDQFENLKFVRIFRLILLTNLVPALAIFKRVIQKEKKILYVVFFVVILTIASFALVIYNIEHGKHVDTTTVVNGASTNTTTTATINSYWDALYFSTITLTTIGFGDKTPITDLGKGLTIIMSIIGIAILTIPSGIIAGGFISEVKEANENRKKKNIKEIFKKKTIKDKEIIAAATKAAVAEVKKEVHKETQAIKLKTTEDVKKIKAEVQKETAAIKKTVTKKDKK